MSRDAYEDRVDDYQRYQNYKYDQKVFQQGLSARNAQVHDAIRRRDYDSAAWALRIPLRRATSADLETSLNEPAHQSLANQVSALICDINESAYISKDLQTCWVAGLKMLPDIDSKTALSRIVDFKIAFSAWKLNNRPEENIWDMGNSRTWLFESQILLIECKVARIRWHLESELRNNR